MLAARDEVGCFVTGARNGELEGDERMGFARMGLLRIGEPVLAAIPMEFVFGFLSRGGNLPVAPCNAMLQW